MKINRVEFVKFLNLLALQGSLQNEEVILEINKDIRALTATQGNIGAIYGELKGEFENIGQIGLGNVKKLSNFLNNFSSEDIDISKDKNYLLLSNKEEKLDIKYSLKDIAYIVNTINKDKFEELLSKGNGNNFKLSKALIDKIITYVISVGTDNFYLTMTNNELVFSAENQEKANSVRAGFNIEEKIKDFSVRVGSNLLEILRNINDDVTISIKNNSPLVVYYNTNKLSFIYLLAQWKKS